tara:strand:+ start:12844 stop:13200 length:357 start_codon:yes stop_codon:yes gene_type:complete
MISKIFNIIDTYWIIITILLSIIILIGSILPAVVITAPSGSDKLFHIISYLFLSFPAAFRALHSYILIFSYFVFFGVAIELLQPHFNRHFEVADIFANTLGTLLGIFFADFIKKYYSY